MTKSNPVKALRQQLSLTQEGLAKMADVSRTTVSNVESGMVDHVPLDVNRALARTAQEQDVPARSWLRDQYNAASLEDALQGWIREHRLEAGLADWPPLTLPQVVDRFPSRRAFCTALCILPATLHNVLDRGIGHGQLETIRRALRAAGYRYGVAFE